jgi:hypothetical protein
LIAKYTWQLDADTHQLGDDDWLHSYFKQRMRKIYWDLGYHDVKDDVLDWAIASLDAK